MNEYFNVKLEFDQSIVDKTIQDAIQQKKKGYVCFIESNNLSIANTNPDFRTVVNNALVNTCDGSNIAKLAGLIHHKPFSSYIGSDLFMKYVSFCKYKQYFLGNTAEVLAGLKENLSNIDAEIHQMPFVELPFRKVDEFDYVEIASHINSNKPDIIWVSLGAPKQEEFMYRLLPYIEQGVMFGIGAAFNFNAGGVGHVKRAPKWMRNLKMEWLYRAFEEPKKNVPRYLNFLKILPRLAWNECKRIK